MPIRRVDCKRHDCEISSHVCGTVASQEVIKASEAFWWARCHLVWRVVDEGPPSHLHLRNLPSRKDESIDEVLWHSCTSGA
ncbi:UNVERIFIED_CONTAM: hypothetical protein Slati_3446300 [Sesamum latifolium]|uniref:Uncharacterized protein n=1 Tax=Sesamum latifolium TaxID=2727402 RepID=A0AAW2UGS6_9LAMI